MQIHIDRNGKEKIRLTVTEKRKVTDALRLLEAVSRNWRDADFQGCIETIRQRCAFLDDPQQAEGRLFDTEAT